MSELSRRQFAAAAAWSAPVILFAVAAPAASASTTPDDPTVCDAYDHDNGRYFVYPNGAVVIEFDVAPDIYEVNVRYPDGTSKSFGTNFGTAPAKGTKVWTLSLPSRPVWVQVHSQNTHLGETC